MLDPVGLEVLCCGQPMIPLAAATAEDQLENHQPILHRTAEELTVSIGHRGHPMHPEHSILWIDVISDQRCTRQYFQPGQQPVMRFHADPKEALTVRAYCNLHGLWQCVSPAVLPSFNNRSEKHVFAGGVYVTTPRPTDRPESPCSAVRAAS